jgi:hypothetical protein
MEELKQPFVRLSTPGQAALNFELTGESAVAEYNRTVHRVD